MNIIQIVSDTFRADFMGCYGCDWVHTPYLDQFARRAVQFDRAYICSFPTVPARYEFLTGMVAFPTFGWEPIPRDQTTLSERLADKGYRCMMIADTSNLFRRGFWYNKGFHGFEWIRGQEGDEWNVDFVDIDPGSPPEKLRGGWQHNIYQHRRNTRARRYERDCFVAQTMSTACDWLERNYKGSPFFLYVDTFDPHEPWDAPEWYVRRYEKEPWTGPRLDYPKNGPMGDLYTQAEMQHIRNLYAAEMTLVDKWVGRLLEKIEDLGLLDHTMIVFTSDHGTQLGEHHIMLKGWTMYDSVVHIPLLVHHPKVKAGRKVRALVQIPDVAATLLDISGAGGLEELHGRSFWPILTGHARAHRRFVTYSPKLSGKMDRLYAGITHGDWSLLFYGNGSPPELYRLSMDPLQKENLANEHPDVLRKLLAEFEQFTRKYGASAETMTALQHILSLSGLSDSVGEISNQSPTES